MGISFSLKRFAWCGDDSHYLRSKLDAANSKVERLQQLCVKQEPFCRVLRVGSPLTEVENTQYNPDRSSSSESLCWQSWCPICKRPLEVTALGSGELYHPVSGNRSWHRHAYVTTLWGEGSGFVLGALVLGQALLQTRTKHELVLLHTNDVSQHSLRLLGRVWTLYLVDYVAANENLFLGGSCSRFSGVFTKLHALGLTQFEKVLLLDIDLAILGSMDALFDLEAPAALWRGQAQTMEHGFPIDGRCFFGGADVDWVQTGGINAGVMLLAPDAGVHQRMLREVEAISHPERIAGAGPEQDYLSRYFAPHWHHLSVMYNCQLHHIWYGLDSAVREYTGVWGDATQPDITHGSLLYCASLPPNCSELPVFKSIASWQVVANLSLGSTFVALSGGVLCGDCPMIPLKSIDGVVDGRHVRVLPCLSQRSEASRGCAALWVPPRLSMDLSNVSVIHFSGEFKMWHRDFLGSENIDDFVDRYLVTNNPDHVRLWMSRTGLEAEYVELGLKYVSGSGLCPVNPDLAAAPLVAIIDAAVERIRSLTKQAAVAWFNGLDDFVRLNTSSSSLEELLRCIGPPGGYLARDCVELFWNREQRWYIAEVRRVRDDGKLELVFGDEFDRSSAVVNVNVVRPHLHNGDHVKLYWESEATWYSASVVEVLFGGKVRLAFDESRMWPAGRFGTNEFRVHLSRLPLSES